MFLRILAIIWFGMILLFALHNFLIPLVRGIGYGISSGMFFSWPDILLVPFAVIFFFAVALTIYFYGGMIVMAILPEQKRTRRSRRPSSGC